MRYSILILHLVNNDKTRFYTFLVDSVVGTLKKLKTTIRTTFTVHFLVLLPELNVINWKFKSLYQYFFYSFVVKICEVAI